MLVLKIFNKLNNKPIQILTFYLLGKSNWLNVDLIIFYYQYFNQKLKNKHQYLLQLQLTVWKLASLTNTIVLVTQPSIETISNKDVFDYLRLQKYQKLF